MPFLQIYKIINIIMRREDVIVYEIYVKSFYDSNGDGIGDLNGITLKLPYLKDLGVNLIWLTPIFVSPQKDNGYDVTDYYEINPTYGTMEDFENLLKEAKKLNINVMLDMVFNHSSDTHKWFQKALKGDKKYQDFYIFKEGKKNIPPTNWISKFGVNTWTYVEELKKWYLHLFGPFQPDLNWKNPELREELFKVINFWIQKGVMGFRFDVVNLTAKPDKFVNDPTGDGHTLYTDNPKVNDYLKLLNKRTFGKDPNIMTIGEMASTSLKACLVYSHPDEHELTMTSSFWHLKVDYVDKSKWSYMKPDIEHLKRILKSWQEGMSKKNSWLANFFSNHDQPRQVSRFGDEKKYHFESATAIAMTSIFFRGTPIIYYGEEIGMTNPKYESIDFYEDVETLNYYKIMKANKKSEKEIMQILSTKSRDNGRCPFYWSGETFAGFSKQKPWLTQGKDFVKINYEKQKDDKHSILNFYKLIIKTRKTIDALKEGIVEFVELGKDIIAYERKLKNEKYLLLANWSGEEKKLSEISFKEIILDNYFSPSNSNSLKKIHPFQAILLKI